MHVCIFYSKVGVRCFTINTVTAILKRIVSALNISVQQQPESKKQHDIISFGSHFVGFEVTCIARRNFALETSGRYRPASQPPYFFFPATFFLIWNRSKLIFSRRRKFVSFCKSGGQYFLSLWPSFQEQSCHCGHKLKPLTDLTAAPSSLTAISM